MKNKKLDKKNTPTDLLSCDEGVCEKCYFCREIDGLNVYFGIIIGQVDGRLYDSGSKTVVNNNVARLLCLLKKFDIGDTIPSKAIANFVWEGKPTSLSSLLQVVHQTKKILNGSNRNLHSIRGFGYIILRNSS